MKIRLIISAPILTEQQIALLHSLGDFQIIEAQKLTAEQVIERIPEVEVLLVGPSGVKELSRQMLAGLKHLKFISILSVGYNWVDVAAAKELGIPISTIKGANAESVAEHTWAMILDLSKRITEFNRDLILKGEYKFHGYQGKEVFGKTIGIIGLGDIGTKVARIAHGFKMKVLGVNNSGAEVTGVELVSLDQLLNHSDVIAVCVPLTAVTQNMIDTAQIEQMKDGVIVVNCAREEVINKKAIIAAIHADKVFGYGIETAVMEPVLEDDEYLSHPRILVTPHNAFNTYEAEMNSFNLAIENVAKFIAGNPQNVIE